MGVEVFRAPLYRRFLADRLTCGYVLALMFQVTVVVMPFFLAYTSEGFWVKTNTFREMPKVSFQYQAMLSAGLKSSDVNDVEVQKVSYALKPESLDLLGENMRIPKIRYWNEDKNLDGFPEKLYLDVELPLKSTEAVHSLDAVFIFQLELSKRSKIRVEAPVVVQHESAFAGESLYTNGVLTFVQRAPLSVRGGFREPYSTAPLLGNSIKSASNLRVPQLSVSELSMPSLIEKIQSRNYTTYLQNPMSSWRQRPEGVTPLTGARPFKFSVVINVPEQTVLYLPSLSEMLKFAFIQYLAMAFIVYHLGWYAIEFVFAYQVVETTSRLDTQYYGPKVHRF